MNRLAATLLDLLEEMMLARNLPVVRTVIHKPDLFIFLTDGSVESEVELAATVKRFVRDDTLRFGKREARRVLR